MEDKAFFAVIRWHKEDIICALEKHNIAPSGENISKFIREGTSTLKDCSVAHGWEVIDDLITNIFT